jgi:ATP-binding cassette subfamily F protein 3
MDSLSELLAQNELKLADNSIYEEDNKAILTQVLDQQASAKAELEEVEMEWMDAQEQLEAMQE